MGGRCDASAIAVPCSHKRKRGSGEEHGDCWQEEESGSGKSSRRLSARQVQVLEKNFAGGLESPLEPAVKKQLALELGMEPRRVAVWFQNRRVRSRAKQLEGDTAALKASFGELAEQHRQLGAEVQLLRTLVSAHTRARLHPGVGIEGDLSALDALSSPPIPSTSADSNRCSHAGEAPGSGDIASVPMQPEDESASAGGSGEFFSSAVCSGMHAANAGFMAVPPPAAPSPAPAPASDKSECSSFFILNETTTGGSSPELEAIASAGSADGVTEYQDAFELPELLDDVWEVDESYLWPCFEDETLLLC